MKEQDLSEQLRQAIKADGRTAYAIAKAADLEPDALYRFQEGKDLRLSSASKVAAVLDLRLAPAKRRGRKKASG